MHQFKCEICQKAHPLTTLLEFPQPSIIAQITSGEINQSLNILGKKTFLINKEYGLFECELTLKINDYEDDLDLLIWVKILKEEIKLKSKYADTTQEITLNGTLQPYLPFYENTCELPVEISIGKFMNDKPKVVAIGKEGMLKNDFNNGIDMDQLKTILSQIHHSS